MRFSDEKHMWYADTEKLAEKLANKTEHEVQEILDKHDVIKLRSGLDAVVILRLHRS